MQSISIALTATLVVSAVACGGDGLGTSDLPVLEGPDRLSGLDADKVVGFPNVRFSLEQVFGADTAPEEAILSSVWAFCVATDGRVFAIDRRGHAIVAFGADGRVLWRQARQGLGPGDLSEPASITLAGSKDRLYVSNQDGHRIDVWSTDGEFLEAHPVFDLGRGVAKVAGFQDPDLLFAWSPIFGDAALDAMVINVSNWEVVRDFRIRSDVGFEVASNYNKNPDLRVTERRVFAGSDGQYLLREFDWNGEVLRIVARESDLLAAPESSMERAASVGTGSVSAPLVLTDGSWITTGHWVMNKDDLEGIFRRESSTLATRDMIFLGYFLDVFDRHGTLAGSLLWEGERPRWAFFSAMDANGSVYSMADDPFPQVRRYRVERTDQ